MAVHSQGLRSPHDASAQTGSHSTVPPEGPPARRGVRDAANRVVSHLATAALLLLTLAVGYVAALQQAPQPPDEPRWTPVMARALAAAGNVGDVVLVEAMFGLDELPTGNKDAIFYRLTIPPGESLTALAGQSCGCPGWPVSGGVGAEVIQSGHYRLRLAAPMQVQRGAVERIETIPPYTEVTLGPGDAAIYPDYTAAEEISVAGDTPVQLVGVAIVGMEPSGAPAPILPASVRGEELSRSVPSDWEKLADAPIGVSLRLVTLPAGTYIDPYEPIGLEAIRVESGTITRYYFASGVAEPTGRPMIWGAGRVSPLLGINPGMRYDLASGDDGPAELLVLIIEPAGITPQTLAP